MKHTVYRQLLFDGIVDILTDKYPSIIQIPGDKTNSGSKLKEIVAANYGDMSLKFLPDSSISLRGFKCNEEIYIINPDKKELLKMPYYRRLLTEVDKISGHPLYLYEGTREDILNEFLEAAYNIVDYKI